MQKDGFVGVPNVASWGWVSFEQNVDDHVFGEALHADNFVLKSSFVIQSKKHDIEKK